MFEHSLTFDRPMYLLLLGLLPLMWHWGRQSLSGLGVWRRWWAFGLRSAVLTLLVLALADAQYRRKSDKLTVVYALDQSLSIPAPQRQAMLQFVKRSVAAHHDDRSEDRFAVVVFGRDAEVEIPLVGTELALRDRMESLLDGEYTDMATAIQRSKALFPHDAAKRIVLVTDGNQNIGDGYREARSAAGAGVSIDVAPVVLASRNEVSVEKIDVPNGVRRGQPFELRVVLNNESTDERAAPIRGKLLVVRKSGNRVEPVAEQDVELPPGKRVLSVRETIDQPDFYSYEARFTAADPQGDGMPQNNHASAYTYIRGKGQALVIENFDKPGEYDFLIDRLRQEEIEVTVSNTSELFTSLAELQRYDVVILANVPRSSGVDADNVSSFTDAQINMLVANTREMGCGLIMLGGPDAFGAGGWTGTELEKAMPVDFQITSSKVVPVGALVLMMHAGEIPEANYWQKRIAVESIKLLGSRDYCGLVQWNNNDQWLWGQNKGGMLQVGPNRKMMLGKVDQMSIGDMPAFDGAMRMAAAAFAGITDASVRHMIIISDGDPTPPTRTTLDALKKQQVKVTTVAVGSHGLQGSDIMREIAEFTGGKYYNVRSANALPKIYQREARRVAQPLVYEPPSPVTPNVVAQHEILRGVESGVPPITGLVLTTVKEHPLVEVLLRSPMPPNPKHSTLLAAWPYGAGRSVAWTTDAGHRWGSALTQWDGYDKFFSQMVRWTMRSSEETGNYSVAANVRDGKTQVVITALDAEDQFLNNQSMTAMAVAPDMTQIALRIQQTAPGRYVGEFDSEMAGSYLISVNPGGGAAPLRTGVNVGYSPEYRDRQTNRVLLESVASLAAGKGPPGQFVEAGLEMAGGAPAEDYNPFRRDLPPAVSNQSIWPWLVLVGSCLFWGDVFVRRVQVNLQWVAPIWQRAIAWILRRPRTVEAPETMSRLRSRKEEIGAEIAARQATTRFQTDPSASPLPSAPTADETATAKPEVRAASSAAPDAPAEESYTERLLKAKKQVWQDKEQEDRPNNN